VLTVADVVAQFRKIASFAGAMAESLEGEKSEPWEVYLEGFDVLVRRAAQGGVTVQAIMDGEEVIDESESGPEG